MLLEEYIRSARSACTLDAVVHQYVLRMDEEVAVSDGKTKRQVLRHIELCLSHRRWIDFAFRLVNKIDSSLPPGMAERIRMHDLSKFSKYEVVGYGYMFGRSSGDGELDGAEKAEWKDSLYHHYSTNDHHPEYYGTGNDMCSEAAFYESVIDRLGCRLERNLLEDGLEKVSADKVFDIAPEYLQKYTAGDRDRVIETLQRWCSALKMSMKNVDIVSFVNMK